MQSPVYGAQNNSQPNNTMYGQYPHVASKPPLAPMISKPTLTPTPTPSIAPAPVATPVAAPVAAPVQSAMPSASPSVPPPLTPRVSVSVSSTPAAPTPSQIPVPQVIVPAPSSEIQQKQQTQKGQVQQQDDQQALRKPGKPPIDYQVLLLSLADDYINAAHGYGTMAAISRGEMDVEEYYKLLATGLGCLEAVLKVG